MARQRLRPDAPPLSKEDIKAGQQVFREWCGDNGIVMGAFEAADLCKKNLDRHRALFAASFRSVKVMRRCVQILICEGLFRLALLARPGNYELASMRRLASDTARATRNDVFMSIREPSNKMLAAAAGALSPAKRPTKDWVTVKEKHRIRYQAMIDAALSISSKECK